MPRTFTRLTKASHSPWIAALVAMIAACIFASFGEIGVVSSLSSFGALLVFFLVNLAVIVLRLTKPNLRRPFCVPLAVGGVPVLPVLGVFVSLGLATRYPFQVYALFLAGVALGLTAFFIRHRLSK